MMDTDGIGFFVMTMGLILVFLALGVFLGYQGGFRRGQIDAMNGKLSYRLVVSEDGASNWNRVNEYSIKTKKELK